MSDGDLLFRGVDINSIKNAAIVILLVMNVYLLATRDNTFNFTDSPLLSTASVAVLPFANISGDAEYEYISDSIWAGTIGALREQPNLTVASHNSTSVFKATDQDARTVGEALDVSYILEGSVRKVGARSRVVVQLIQVDDQSHVWSHTYDRGEGSLESVHGDIADSVALAIKNN